MFAHGGAGIGGGLVFLYLMKLQPPQLPYSESSIKLSLLSFLSGVEDKLTLACWCPEGFGLLEIVSPSLQLSSLRVALSLGVFWMTHRNVTSGATGVCPGQHQ